jgi:hypothetical protein
VTGFSQQGGKRDKVKVCAYFASDRIQVVGPEDGIRKALAVSASRPSGPLDPDMGLLAGDRHVVAAGDLPNDLRQDLLKLARSNKQASPHVPLFELRSGTAVAHLNGNTLTTELLLRYDSDDKARSAKSAADGAFQTMKDGVGLLRSSMLKTHKNAELGLNALANAANSLRATQEGSNLTIKGEADASVEAIRSLLTLGDKGTTTPPRKPINKPKPKPNKPKPKPTRPPGRPSTGPAPRPNPGPTRPNPGTKPPRKG